PSKMASLKSVRPVPLGATTPTPVTTTRCILSPTFIRSSSSCCGVGVSRPGVLSLLGPSRQTESPVDRLRPFHPPGPTGEPRLNLTKFSQMTRSTMTVRFAGRHTLQLLQRPGADQGINDAANPDRYAQGPVHVRGAHDRSLDRHGLPRHHNLPYWVVASKL